MLKKFSIIVSFVFLALLAMFGYVSAQNVKTGAGLDLTKYDKDGFLLVQPNMTQKSLSNSSSSASNIATTSPDTINSADIKQGQSASCFDYYTFGSVDVNLTSNFSSYQPGDPMMIVGKIKNKNRYPVVGLDVKARLVKNIPQPDKMRSEIMILDEFNVASNITIDAGGEFKVSYSHILPLNAPAGEYQVLFYAVEQDRFNLAGLSFTNDIVASRIDFNVLGKNPDHAYLDQTKIMVGDQPHNVMAFMTQHAPDTQIPITIPLVNPTSANVQMKVTYNLYSWDSANSENKINTKTEKIDVPAKSEKKLTYTLEKVTLPVYYLSITALPANETKDTSIFQEKTISNIRLVVNGKSQPRLNFVGIDSYPLKQGLEATLVTCFHNTSNIVDTNVTKIETILYDQNNKELSRIQYEGKTLPEISGLINKFTPSNDIPSFTIISKMYDAQGKIIDSVEKKYSCEDINSTFCSTTKPIPTILFGLVALISIIIVIGLSILQYKRKTINNLKI
ncbi:MAG: hypothetical protein WCJ74_01945 [bacterium]